MSETAYLKKGRIAPEDLGWENEEDPADIGSAVNPPPDDIDENYFKTSGDDDD